MICTRFGQQVNEIVQDWSNSKLFKKLSLQYDLHEIRRAGKRNCTGPIKFKTYWKWSLQYDLQEIPTAGKWNCTGTIKFKTRSKTRPFYMICTRFGQQLNEIVQDWSNLKLTENCHPTTICTRSGQQVNEIVQGRSNLKLT